MMHKKFLLLLCLIFIISVSTKLVLANDDDEIDTTDEIVDLQNDNDIFAPINNATSDSNQYNPAEVKHAKIIALNKITAKSKEIVLKLGTPQYFGNIQIIAHKCVKNIDPYNPENKILLTVTENKIDDDAVTIFDGWMFSSSISISTLEHPVYEIFARECF